MSQSTQIKDYGNMIIKGQDMITMAANATKTSSNGSRKARIPVKQMSEIIREAKKLIFLNSEKVATATAQTKKMFEPKETIIIRNQSRNINHLHAVKVVIEQPQ